MIRAGDQVQLSVKFGALHGPGGGWGRRRR
jgi:hypothetical protein